MSKQPHKYRLDRTAFSIMTFEKANNYYGYWKHKPVKDRLDAAFFLIQQIFGTTNGTPLDKSVFSYRKHSV